MNKEYCIYIHKNKINSKVYIGQTCQKPEYRWNNGNGYKQCTLFYRAIQKYGWDNFEHIILIDKLNKEQANLLETQYIKQYQSNNPKYGYNLESGGNSTVIKSGKEHFAAQPAVCLETGQIFNTETEASIWAGYKENKGHIYKSCIGERITAGKHPVTKEPLHWLLLKDYTIENKNKKMTQIKKPDPKIKQIRCKNTGQIFNSLTEIQEWTGLKSKSGISLACNGKRQFAGKHPITKEKLEWEYI